MNKYVVSFILLLFSVFISSVSQVMLKKSAERKHESVVREYINYRVISAYFIYFLSTVLTMLSYRYIPLSTGTVLGATGYIWVAILSKGHLKEPICGGKWAALAIILAGVMIFNL